LHGLPRGPTVPRRELSFGDGQIVNVTAQGKEESLVESIWIDSTLFNGPLEPVCHKRVPLGASGDNLSWTARRSSAPTDWRYFWVVVTLACPRILER